MSRWVTVGHDYVCLSVSTKCPNISPPKRLINDSSIKLHNQLNCIYCILFGCLELPSAMGQDAVIVWFQQRLYAVVCFRSDYLFKLCAGWITKIFPEFASLAWTLTSSHILCRTHACACAGQKSWLARSSGAWDICVICDMYLYHAVATVNLQRSMPLLLFFLYCLFAFACCNAKVQAIVRSSHASASSSQRIPCQSLLGPWRGFTE